MKTDLPTMENEPAVEVSLVISRPYLIEHNPDVS